MSKSREKNQCFRSLQLVNSITRKGLLVYFLSYVLNFIIFINYLENFIDPGSTNTFNLYIIKFWCLNYLSLKYPLQKTTNTLQLKCTQRENFILIKCTHCSMLHCWSWPLFNVQWLHTTHGPSSIQETGATLNPEYRIGAVP